MSRIYTMGILAGMGPRSTTPFLESVLDECEWQYGAKWDNDFPHILVYSLPTPFHPKKPLEHGKMLENLKVGINTLSNANCDIIAIPCNVVHLYYEQMCEMTKTPILHIVRETMKRLHSQPARIGLLATRATVESGIYQEQAKGKNFYWSEQFQRKVDELIVQVKTLGNGEEVVHLWRDIERMMINEGVSEVVCACTDLFFCSQTSRLKFFDSSQILASSLVKRYIRKYPGSKG